MWCGMPPTTKRIKQTNKKETRKKWTMQNKKDFTKYN